MISRLLLGLAIVGFASVSDAVGADKPKDSPAAASLRKKLETKVSVDFKEARIKDVVEDLKGQVENLSIYIDNTSGVSNNQTITYKAADKPLREVLNDMCDKAGDLGYLIGQAKDKRYDGWIIFRKGKFRGDEVASSTTGKTTKPKDNPKTAKPDTKTETKPEDSAEKAEQDAARKLKLAKSLDADGLKDKAKARYKEIVEKYPGTKAAKEAKELLDK